MPSKPSPKKVLQDTPIEVCRAFFFLDSLSLAATSGTLIYLALCIALVVSVAWHPFGLVAFWPQCFWAFWSLTSIGLVVSAGLLWPGRLLALVLQVVQSIASIERVVSKGFLVLLSQGPFLMSLTLLCCFSSRFFLVLLVCA